MAIWYQERGDTIVEVAFAFAIISFVIIASFASSSAAMRLGLSARQRNEATNLTQQQFEVLQGMRDSYLLQGTSPGWDTYRATIFGDTNTHPICGSTTPVTIHLTDTKSGNHTDSWTVASGVGLYATEIANYNLGINACYVDNFANDRIRFDVNVNWVSTGGTAQNSSASLEITNVNDIHQLNYMEIPLFETVRGRTGVIV